MFTFHGYRTWMPDHPEGYTRKGKGFLSPDEAMNRHYEERARHDEVRFDDARQELIVAASREIATNINARIYYAVCVDTHCHVLLGWHDERDWTALHDRMKRIIALKLGRAEGVRGRRWLTQRRSSEQVQTPDHFAHLMTVYLPDHRGRTYFDPHAMEDARVYTRGPDGS
jgi:hypothetical protein